MLSIDANILLYAFNTASPWNESAAAWLTSIRDHDNVAISGFILAEFYGLLRNPALLKRPLPADEAVEVIQIYRRHPRWRLIGFSTESRALHDALWKKASASAFAFRKLYDTRSALAMTAQGVTEVDSGSHRSFYVKSFPVSIQTAQLRSHSCSCVAEPRQPNNAGAHRRGGRGIDGEQSRRDPGGSRRA